MDDHPAPMTVTSPTSSGGGQGEQDKGFLGQLQAWARSLDCRVEVREEKVSILRKGTRY